MIFFLYCCALVPDKCSDFLFFCYSIYFLPFPLEAYKAFWSDDLIVEVLNKKIKTKNQHLTMELDKYSRSINIGEIQIIKRLLCSMVAVKMWDSTLWWNMMLLHLLSDSQPKTTLQWDRYVASVEWCSVRICIAGCLTLFHSPERTFRGDSNLFKSDSPQALLFQMDEAAHHFWHWGLCDLLTLGHRFHPAMCVYVSTTVHFIQTIIYIIANAWI